MYHSVLLPTDGTRLSLRALEHALDIAVTYEAALHTLYVVDPASSHNAADDGFADAELAFELLEREGKQALEAAEAEADRVRIPFVGAIRTDSRVPHAIQGYARENGIDLIVMGTHGRRGLNRWLAGSVAETVVRTADVPVLTVRDRPESKQDSSRTLTASGSGHH